MLATYGRPARAARRRVRVHGVPGFPAEAIAVLTKGSRPTTRGATGGANKDDLRPGGQEARCEALLAEVDRRSSRCGCSAPTATSASPRTRPRTRRRRPPSGECEGGTVYYVQLSATGLFVGTGHYHMATDQLDAVPRAPSTTSAPGPSSSGSSPALEKAKATVAAHDELKTAPRGYAKDHPRIDLLRRKGLMASRSWPVAAWLSHGQGQGTGGGVVAALRGRSTHGSTPTSARASWRPTSATLR